MPIPFSRVNRPGAPGYVPDHQRHHIIPRALAARTQFAILFARVGPIGFSLSDFATNGVLLPCTERAAFETRRPLHNGSHPIYTDRIAGYVDVIWLGLAPVPDCAKAAALAMFRLRLLQLILKRELVHPRDAMAVDSAPLETFIADMPRRTVCPPDT